MYRRSQYNNSKRWRWGTGHADAALHMLQEFKQAQQGIKLLLSTHPPPDIPKEDRMYILIHRSSAIHQNWATSLSALASHPFILPFIHPSIHASSILTRRPILAAHRISSDNVRSSCYSAVEELQLYYTHPSIEYLYPCDPGLTQTDERSASRPTCATYTRISCVLVMLQLGSSTPLPTQIPIPDPDSRPIFFCARP